jgi:hypothetical protein
MSDFNIFIGGFCIAASLWNITEMHATYRTNGPVMHLTYYIFAGILMGLGLLSIIKGMA